MAKKTQGSGFGVEYSDLDRDTEMAGRHLKREADKAMQEFIPIIERMISEEYKGKDSTYKSIVSTYQFRKEHGYFCLLVNGEISPISKKIDESYASFKDDRFDVTPFDRFAEDYRDYMFKVSIIGRSADSLRRLQAIKEEIEYRLAKTPAFNALDVADPNSTYIHLLEENVADERERIALELYEELYRPKRSNLDMGKLRKKIEAGFEGETVSNQTLAYEYSIDESTLRENLASAEASYSFNKIKISQEIQDRIANPSVYEPTEADVALGLYTLVLTEIKDIWNKEDHAA